MEIRNKVLIIQLVFFVELMSVIGIYYGTSTTILFYCRLVFIGVMLVSIFYRKTLPMNFVIYIVFFLFTNLITYFNCGKDIQAIVNISTWIAVYYLASTFEGGYQENERILNIWAVLFFIFSCFSFFTRAMSLYGAAARNGIYYALFTVPFVLNIKKKWFRTLLLILCIAITMYSMKRTTIVALLTSIFVFYLIETIFQNDMQAVRKLIKFTVIAVIALVLLQIVYNWVVKNTGYDIMSRFSSIKDGNDGGRTEIFSNVLNLFNGSGVFSRIFGKGYNSVSRSLGISAHNDFLNTLVDFGLVGICMLVFIFVDNIKVVVRLILRRSEFAGSAAAMLTTWVIVSLSSELVSVPTYFLLCVLFFGLMKREVMYVE